MKVNRDGVGGDAEVHIMAPFFSSVLEELMVLRIV